MSEYSNEENCIPIGFNQTLVGSETLQSVFVEFRDCDVPQYNNRCDKLSFVKPYRSFGPKFAKCVDGFAEVFVYVQDNRIYNSMTDTTPIPDSCHAGANKFGRCKWKFKILCDCALRVL